MMRGLWKAAALSLCSLVPALGATPEPESLESMIEKVGFPRPNLCAVLMIDLD